MLIFNIRNEYYLFVFFVFQREARGSVTFKIVPSYRSAPPPCEVQVSPKIRDHSPTLTTFDITTITTTTATTTSTSIETIHNSASNQKSMNPIASSSKEKPVKSQKTGKTKSTSSSSDSTPRRRLVNPLSVLRSRKSHT